MELEKGEKDKEEDNDVFDSFSDGISKNRNKEEPKPTVSCKQQICIFRFIDSSATAEPAASTNCFGRFTFTDLTLTSIIKAEIGKEKDENN